MIDTPAAMPLSIAGRLVGPGHPPLIIAELSGNHNRSLERALALVDAAAGAGAEAVKLQTYTADTITIDHDGPGFRLTEGLWAGRTLHDLYGEAATPYEWHGPLFARAREHGLIPLSTPFDETAVALLESLDAPVFKIASFEAIDLPLIRRTAASGRPLIISTGMTDRDEIGQAVGAAADGGAPAVALLHCVSEYPARFADARLGMVRRLGRDFGCVTGLSDHTPGTAASVAAVALGACIIEKHFTLRRADGGPDSAFSLEPEELQRLVQDCRAAWEAVGEADDPAGYCRSDAEVANRQFRRSLYVVRDVAPGTALTHEDVRSIRPGFGLAPKALPEVIGRIAVRPLARGEPFAWDMVD